MNNDLFIDLTPFCGTYEWQQITFNGSNFCVPDIEYICRFILLCIIIYYLIKVISNINYLFK
ncbi:MAG: hypothetical protein ACLRRH_11440 [Clostridium sp.]